MVSFINHRHIGVDALIEGHIQTAYSRSCVKGDKETTM